ncbi:glycosyltransferase family 39 protein [Streptomyces chiangmaiensis]|uniref:Glycosyltransferase family 39 protein n=1 Tax=Streptomyces chiangmaiensis TaxID=766497 RepID=A0ABU7FS82_9ACTN|nr:glycosyltransferase family 39 protein [Streptomyces chiangmaiensis]MED7826323.1 glycosyltransferase family 39 protein [Streptomyces chiangmaiensis]
MATYRIGEPLLGRDELTSWDMSGRSIGQVLATVHRVDGVLGTYYLILREWRSLFGDSATALRMPSALAMAGAAACVALIGHRLFGRRAGVAGGLLFALIPTVSRFAHEARPYGLVMLAVALTALLLLRALDRPGSPWRWTGYTLGLVAVGLFHLLALTCLIGHLVLVALRVRRERRAWWGFCLAVLVGLASVCPLVVLGRAQTVRQIYWIAEPTGWGLVDIWPQLFYSGVCAGTVTLLAMVACRERRDAVVFCAVSALAPVFLIWAISHGEISYFYFRYMLFTLPALAVLAGAGLAAATRSRPALASTLAALALFTASEQESLREPLAHYWSGGPDFAAAARTIQSYYVPGDAVVYPRKEEEAIALGVRYYLPRDLKLRDVFLAESPTHRNDLAATECPQPTRCLRGEKRIWLVVRGDETDPLNGLPADQSAALRTHYRLYGAERPSGLAVALLVRTS